MLASTNLCQKNRLADYPGGLEETISAEELNCNLAF